MQKFFIIFLRVPWHFFLLFPPFSPFFNLIILQNKCRNIFITKNNGKYDNYSIAETLDIGGLASEPDK